MSTCSHFYSHREESSFLSDFFSFLWCQFFFSALFSQFDYVDSNASRERHGVTIFFKMRAFHLLCSTERCFRSISYTLVLLHVTFFLHAAILIVPLSNALEKDVHRRDERAQEGDLTVRKRENEREREG